MLVRREIARAATPRSSSAAATSAIVGQARRRAEREAHRGAGRDADEDGGRGAADRRPALQHRAGGARARVSGDPSRRAARVRCALTTQITAAAIASRMPGKCRSFESPITPRRRASRRSRCRAARSASTACERDREQRLDGDARPARDQRGRPAGAPVQSCEQADQDRPDRRRATWGSARRKRRNETLERSRRLRGDDTRERQQRGDQPDDVGRAPHARLIARCCVEPATATQQPAQINRSAAVRGARPCDAASLERAERQRYGRIMVARIVSLP